MSALRSIKRWFIDPQFSRKKEFLRSLDIFKDLRDRMVQVMAEETQAGEP